MNNEEEEKIKGLLRGIQLDQYYRQIHGKLHVTRLSHFEHVTESDLDDLGMAKPEQRRLQEALKKAKKKSLFSSFRRKKSKKTDQTAGERTSCYGTAGESLTCLISEQSLAMFEMLGNGAFGYVRRGTWIKDSHKRVLVAVAVKCLKLWSDEAFQQMQMEFIKEANAMSLLDHPHIIRLHGIVLSVPMMLVTELAPLGCLLTQLRNEPHNFTINTLSDFVIQIASGMAYLESHRFVHRDLAARNLLLESYEKVKIGDFGMMRVLSGDDDHYTMHPSGKVPFAWCPQEVLRFRKFSHASDVWAFGITITELFSYGMEPWPGLNGAEILEKVDLPLCERPKKPEHCPPDLYSILLSHCWAHEPHQRSRFSALKKMMEEVHPVNANAIFPYESKCQQNLSFQEGDIITLLEASMELSWWKGQNMRTRQVGLFPSELVESGLRKAVCPVKSKSPPKARSPEKQYLSQPNCDCGAPHIYDTAVVVSPSEASVSSSARSSSQSSRSSVNTFNSSTECDSGYSSSVDTRKLNVMNGDSSPEERKVNLVASYENTYPCFGKQDSETYELMFPMAGPVSSPIPIPKKSSGEPRYVRNHCLPSAPQFREGKCPLDFTSFNEDDYVVIKKTNSPPLLPPRKPASQPASPVSHSSLMESERRAKTPSPSAIKKAPLVSGLGEAFTNEMLTYLETVSVNGRPVDSAAKQVKDDVYEVLSRPFVPVKNSQQVEASKGPSSKSQRNLKREHFYENHSVSAHDKNTRDPQSTENGGQDVAYERVRCNSGQNPCGNQALHGVRWNRCNTWPTKQWEAERVNSCYDSHNLKGTDASRAGSPYDNCKIRNEKYDPQSSISQEVQVGERGTCKSLQPTYENIELRVGQTSGICYENVQLGTAFLPKPEPPLSGRETKCMITAQPCYENFTPKQIQDDVAERDANVSSGKLFQNCQIQDHTDTISSKSVAIPGMMEDDLLKVEAMSRSLPTNCNFVRLVSGEELGSLSMVVGAQTSPPLRRTISADAIRDGSSSNEEDCSGKSPAVSSSEVVLGQTDGEVRPIPPPRWKRIARMNQTLSLDPSLQQRWAVDMTPELASVLLKRLKITEGILSPPKASNDDSSRNKDLGTRKPPLYSETGSDCAVGEPYTFPVSRSVYENVETSSITSVGNDQSVELSYSINSQTDVMSAHINQSLATSVNRRQSDLTSSAVEQSDLVSVSSGQSDDASSKSDPHDTFIRPPEIPPKIHGADSNHRASRHREICYENVDIVTTPGTFANNSKRSSELAATTPPPLPGKLSRSVSSSET